MKKNHRPQPVTLTRFILACLKPFKLLIAGQLFVGIVWAIDISLRPYIFKQLIDCIPTLTADTAIDGLLAPSLLYITMSCVIFLVFRFYEYLCIKLNPFLKRHIGHVLMHKMMGHSQTLFQNHFAGNLANKIKEVMSCVPDLIRVVINHFYSHLLACVIAVFTVSTINNSLAYLMAAWLAIFIGGSILFSRRSNYLSNVAAEVRSRVMGQFVDILTNMLNIHLFAAKNIESKKLGTYLDDYVKSDQKRDWWFLYMATFQGLSFLIYQAIAFVLLCLDFKRGQVTAGDFVMLLTLNSSIVTLLWTISDDLLRVSEFVGNIRQGLSIVMASHDIVDQLEAKPLQVTRGEITFDKVHFNYKDTHALFNSKSITIKAGEKVGLVGFSGGGKTTFVNLILRLYDVTSGRIMIDGQDIKNVTQDSLRYSIGMIPQDPSLFHRSLIENIRYGRIDATDEDVILAAKQAHAHDFILKLPKGYDSLVGERGVKLSGGQRQRVAIARAILKDAPILILDEATSQLDSVTESDIQDSLWQLMQHKTTLVIAHRLSTLLHMDRILVFDRGKIVEDGHHEELLKKGGLYATLWDAQVGGFIVDKDD